MEHTNPTVWLPPPEKDLAAARRQHMELYGSVTVYNRYLRIALLGVSAALAASVLATVKIVDHYSRQGPIVVRVYPDGRAEAAQDRLLQYQPQENEMKYFLIQFVQLHLGRVRATLKADFAKSLFFLDGLRADAAMDAAKKTKLIETFLTDHSDEVDIHVTAVAIEDTRSAPYRAKVEYEKVYFSYPDHREVRRERYTGNFVFTFRLVVSNDMIPVNPLGFTITYFREDQGF